MFIGVIGTRYSGKTTICEYLKTRGFTVLLLRDATHDEDTSTAASSNDSREELSHAEGTSTDQLYEDSRQIAGTSSSVPKADHYLSRELPNESHTSSSHLEPESNEWGSRTPESHVNRDVLKEDLISAFRRNDGKMSIATSLRFHSPTEMLDYATRHWRQDFVTEDLSTRELLEPFLKRPFFLLVDVDAPLMVRLERARDVSLKQFVEEHDVLMYGTGPVSPPNSHHLLRQLTNVTVVNSYQSIERLWEYLDQVDLTNPDRLRPQWDSYFMTLASLASQRSNCMKRRVGAILVRNNRILATGYNGTPRGLTNCNEGGCARCNGKAKSGEALDECLCLHAEENALLEAGRERVGDGAVLYCNTCPCLRCSVKIVQTGVKEVVYNLAYSMDAAAAEVFIGAGIVLRQHTPSM